MLELRPGARTIAALIEPRLHESLRNQHDEDWFRNPRTGETLSVAVDTMRAHGLFGWVGGEAKDYLDPAPLARRATEALRAARR